MPARRLLPADLFPKYIRLRQRGVNPDDALDELARLAGELTLAQQQQLASMIGVWEVSGASKAQPRELPAQPTVEVQAPLIQVVCPHCGLPNPVEGDHCFACGRPLVNAYGGTNRLAGNDELATASFGQNLRLTLVPQFGDAIEIDLPENDDIIIGRVSDDPIAVPSVDLSLLGAQALGVSRLHAAVRRQQDVITITDLDSVNHSYINGQRLHPQEVRALHHGDELRLGRLVLQVRIKSEG